MIARIPLAGLGAFQRRPSLRQCLHIAAIALLLSMGSYADSAEASDDDRSRAECIEEYNDPALHKPDRGFRFNPFSLQISGNGLLAGGSSGARAVTNDLSWGGTIDFDTPVVAIPGYSAKRLVLGLALGASGMAVYNENNWQWNIELRLGAVRRRLDMVKNPDCRRHRTDLVLYFLRWRAGNFIDLKEAGQPGTFNSTLSPATAVVRNMYQTGGTSLGASLDFRMVRSLQPGLRITGEWYVGHYFLRVTLAGYLPHPTGYLGMGIGYTFEFLGSP